MSNIWKELKEINSRENRPVLALAPMAGITDKATRELCGKYGADVVYTEMVSTDGIFYNSEKTLRLLDLKDRRVPTIVQLFGKNPESFAKAAKVVSEDKKYRGDGIDINLGCPAKKVFGHGSGAALMNEVDKVRDIIQAVLDNTDLPVSIKIRTAVKKVQAIDFLKEIKDLDISGLMVHGRTYDQGFVGDIDTEVVQKIIDLVDFPVLVNGGVMSPEDAEKTWEKVDGAIGLGIARGIYGRPWIFEEIKEYFQKGECKEKDWKEIKKIMIKHCQLAKKDKGDRGMLEMRKWLAWYTKGFDGARKLRNELVRVESIDEVKKILK